MTWLHILKYLLGAFAKQKVEPQRYDDEFERELETCFPLWRDYRAEELPSKQMTDLLLSAKSSWECFKHNQEGALSHPREYPDRLNGWGILAQRYKQWLAQRKSRAAVAEVL